MSKIEKLDRHFVRNNVKGYGEARCSTGRSGDRYKTSENQIQFKSIKGTTPMFLFYFSHRWTRNALRAKNILCNYDSREAIFKINKLSSHYFPLKKCVITTEINIFWPVLEYA